MVEHMTLSKRAALLLRSIGLVLTVGAGVGSIVASGGGGPGSGPGAFGDSLDIHINGVAPNPLVIDVSGGPAPREVLLTIDYELIGTATDKDRSSCKFSDLRSTLPGVSGSLVELESQADECATQGIKAGPVKLGIDLNIASQPSGNYTARVELGRCYDDISAGGPKCISAQFDFTITLRGAAAPAPPGAPSNFGATIDGSTVVLSWRSGPGAQGHVVERQTATGAYITIATLPAFTTTYRDANAASDTMYSYRLTATNETGPSLPAAASAQTGLVQVQVQGNGVVRSTPAGIDCGNDCEERFALGTVWQLTATPAVGWRLVQFTGDPRCGAPSVAVTSETLICTAVFESVAPPATPVDLRASVVSGTVELRWARVGVGGVASYELTRRPGNNGAASRVVSFAGPADNHVDSTVNSDTTYTYELVARNSGGSSAAASVIATTLVNPDWTRIGASDIDARPAFAQPSLAITANGNSVGVAQVITGGAFEQTQVFRTDAFAQNSWTRLAGTPGGGLAPAANGTQPALALDSQGTALIAWTQAGAAGNDVRVARYDTNGAQWLPLGTTLDLDLGSPALNDATLPAIVIDAADRPVVGWLQGGSVYVRRWNGSAWEPVGGSGSVNGPGFAVDAFRLVLDVAGTPHVLVRRGAASAARLFAFRASSSNWETLGGALNAPLTAPRDSLSFFDFVIEADDAALAVWSEGSAPHDVLAARWRGGAWQALPKIVDFETAYAITGLAAARSVQAATINPSPPVVMLTRSPVFPGSNPSNGYGHAYFLQNDVWQARPPLLTRGPMFGLTLRVTRQATPVAAWLAETGAVGSGELQLFVWSGAF